jgi:hypothetical protein
VGVLQVGGEDEHESAEERFDKKSICDLRDSVKTETSPEQAAQARALATAIAASSEEELRAIVRMLLDADAASLLGASEFKIRDLALKIAAKAYEQRLAQQKRLRSFFRELPRL